MSGGNASPLTGGLLSASGTDSEQDIGHSTLLTESSPEADSHGEDQSSPQDGTDARSTFCPQKMSSEERKEHRAEVARRAKAAKRVRPLSTP